MVSSPVPGSSVPIRILLRSHVPLLIALALGAGLLLTNLGDRALWDDEAQTAVLGRHVSQHGLPLFSPADNLPTDRADRADFNPGGVFTWNTWLPFYLTAGSFVLFGESEQSARLPFALVGLLSLLVYYKLCCRAFPRDRLAVVFALVLLVCCVPFLLHVRQCRYYALAVLGTLWISWGYLSILRGERRGWVHLAAAGLLAFHSFYVVAGIDLAGVWLHALWKERKRTVLRDLGLSSLAIVVLALPMVLYLRLWAHPHEDPLTAFAVTRSFWVYLLWINGFVMPLVLPVAAAFVAGHRWRWHLLVVYLAFLVGAALEQPAAQAVSAIALLAALSICIAAFVKQAASVQRGTADQSVDATRLFGLLGCWLPLYVVVMSVASPFPFYRYLLPVVPLTLLFAAALIRTLAARRAILGYATLAVIVMSNVSSAVPLKLVELLRAQKADGPEYSVSPRELWRWTQPRFDLGSFLNELTHHVADPEEGVARYLEDKGSAGQTVKVSYGDISLMFYRPEMRIVSRWDRGGGVPDFVVVRHPYPLAQDPRSLSELKQVRYVAEKIPYPDLVWSNNPDPLFHRFAIPADRENLIIHRRATAASP